MKDDAISFKALFSRFTGALSMSGRHLALHLIHLLRQKQTRQTQEILSGKLRTMTGERAQSFRTHHQR